MLKRICESPTLLWGQLCYIVTDIKKGMKSPPVARATTKKMKEGINTPLGNVGVDAEVVRRIEEWVGRSTLVGSVEDVVINGVDILHQDIGIVL